MSVVEVARKDFLDVRRSKMMWLVVTILTGFSGLFVYFQTSQIPYFESARAGVVSVLNGVLMLGSFLVPIVAFVAAYLAIAGERETGSLKFMLGLPNTRRDIVVGKFLSRCLVIGLGLASAALGVTILLALFYPLVPIVPFFVMLGLLTLYAVVYVALAIGISAAVASKARAAAAGFGLYFVLNVGTFLASPGALVRTVHADVLGLGESPLLYQFVSLLVPPEALLYGATAVAEPNGPVTSPPADAPFFVQPTFMPVVLSAWIVLSVAIGYYAFESANVS
ncbi:ABC transporter permease [Halostagnicola kamekurae]|uniref:ABC-2 type transport system permease protein n=1 Tax=Halostagnicola kamekurae TaxID=619731 RepID=A0A1I6QMX0_9EURY|nr:ABC transporter permease subunit [Halostagnicola kamekurae]SFS53678.1 ABC-2 type transport system permease protein [Halostagnicola kamekurae]